MEKCILNVAALIALTMCYVSVHSAVFSNNGSLLKKFADSLNDKSEIILRRCGKYYFAEQDFYSTGIARPPVQPDNRAYYVRKPR